MSPAERILWEVSDSLGEIADELQQGQMIEEDDALGRRILDLTARIAEAISLSETTPTRGVKTVPKTVPL